MSENFPAIVRNELTTVATYSFQDGLKLVSFLSNFVPSKLQAKPVSGMPQLGQPIVPPHRKDMSRRPSYNIILSENISNGSAKSSTDPLIQSDTQGNHYNVTL